MSFVNRTNLVRGSIVAIGAGVVYAGYKLVRYLYRKSGSNCQDNDNSRSACCRPDLSLTSISQ